MTEKTELGHSETSMTPVWCSRCGMYVPVECEPHCSPEYRDLHYVDFSDRLETERWKRNHSEDD